MNVFYDTFLPVLYLHILIYFILSVLIFFTIFIIWVQNIFRIIFIFFNKNFYYKANMYIKIKEWRKYLCVLQKAWKWLLWMPRLRKGKLGDKYGERLLNYLWQRLKINVTQWIKLNWEPTSCIKSKIE